MLTRATIKCNKPMFMVRLLTDKFGDSGNPNPSHSASEEKVSSNENAAPKKKSNINTEKIQNLLKNMLEASKKKEQAMSVPIVTAPGLFKNKPAVFSEEKFKEEIEEKVTAAVSEVATSLGGDTKKTEAELLSRVLGDVSQAPTNLSDLVLGMKVEKSKKPSDGFQRYDRGEQVRRIVERSHTPASRMSSRKQSDLIQNRSATREMEPMKLDLFSESPLGILKPLDNPNPGPRLETWEKLKERELNLMLSQPPRNYFEKMIQWTEEGKVWKFPIDNEQGMEEEAKVHFSEHVLVENHLEGWCPQKGPIRHFMELVCVGLSKNPFYTAQEKKDHIMWFKEYFESKKDMLADIGALGDSAKEEQTKTI